MSIITEIADRTAALLQILPVQPDGYARASASWQVGEQTMTLSISTRRDTDDGSAE